MNGRNLVLMLLVFSVAMRYVRIDFASGLAICMGLFVSMPDYLRLSFGGGIPELTIQRLLLIGLLICWRSASQRFCSRSPVPFLRGLLAFGAAQFVSLLFSIHTSGSLKSLVAYSLEIVLLFSIVSIRVQDREAVRKVLYGIGIGLGGVAVLAAVEKYWGLNVTRQVLLGNGMALEDTTSTYPHRILLGYAMAMGVPILFALAEREQRKLWKRLLWCMVLLLIAGCYFSNSRGPWSALIAGALLFFFLGSRSSRKAAIVVAVLGALVLGARPGVRETIWGLIFSTFEQDSLKAKSYEYRWRLWHVAYAEITKSPERALLGYGGLSTETMDLSHYFEKESGGTAAILGFTSWDNQLACDLIEFGFVGFLVEVGVLLAVMCSLVSLWFRSADTDRSMMAAFTVACAIFMYAMTNVYIFSPQLKCLFWALVACGLKFGQCAGPSAVNETEQVLEQSQFLQA